MEFILDGQEYIELNRLLKMLSLVGTGGEAKIRISEGEVKVNGEVEHRVRRKLKPGDKITFNEEEINIRG